MRLIASPRDDFEVSPKRKNCIVNGILTPFDNSQESISSIKACTISQFQNKCSNVTIKGSLNISLHFVSSKPKAKISSHFF